MSEMNYRIESSHPIVGPLLSGPGATEILIFDRSMAIVVAAKSVTVPYGSEIRVVRIDTGEVVFRKTAANCQMGASD